MSISADELASAQGSMVPLDATAMLPIGYAYDPVASDVAAMQQLALDAGTPPVMIGVEDPVVGDWGADGSGADAFLVVTATTSPADTEPPVQTAVPIQTAVPVQTSVPVQAGFVFDPAAWTPMTWLLIGGAAWLLLKK